MLIWIAAIHVLNTRRTGDRASMLDNIYLCTALFADAVLEAIAIVHLIW
jgi:hypothetical protein